MDEEELDLRPVPSDIQGVPTETVSQPVISLQPPHSSPELLIHERDGEQHPLTHSLAGTKPVWKRRNRPCRPASHKVLCFKLTQTTANKQAVSACLQGGLTDEEPSSAVGFTISRLQKEAYAGELQAQSSRKRELHAVSGCIQTVGGSPTTLWPGSGGRKLLD